MKFKVGTTAYQRKTKTQREVIVRVSGRGEEPKWQKPLRQALATRGKDRGQFNSCRGVNVMQAKRT
jgi:hypothetical protein